MSRILIADDQVPREDLGSEDEIRHYYLEKHKDPGFAEGFVFLHKMIRTLKSEGYEVVAVNKLVDVLDAIKVGQFDVVLLDLGWWTAEGMPYDDKMVLGWRIAEQVKEHSSAPIIMFSNRFFEDQSLSRVAAEKGMLPVYKSFDEACMRQAIVTIKYAVMIKPIGAILRDRQKIHAFNMYKKLSNVLLYAILASVVLLIVSVALAVTNTNSASITSSVFGFVITFINGAIFKYIRQYKNDFMYD